MNAVARKDGYKQAAQARRLLAHVTVSSEVRYFTTTDEAGMNGQDCAARFASQAFEVGALTIARMELYYIVPSKCEGRYYVIARRDGAWVSSAKDKELGYTHLAKVSSYRLAASRADMTEADFAEELRDSLAYDFGGDACLVAAFMH